MTIPLRLRIEGAALRAALKLPRAWLVRVLGGRRVERDGCVLDEQLQLIAFLAKKMGRAELRGRRALAIERAAFDLDAASLVHRPVELHRVRDLSTNAGTPLRVYTPRGAPASAPTVVFYHGGGFVFGGLASHDGICRALAHDVGCVVVAVDYRVAPEHAFPAAVDDATAAFRWIVGNASTLGVDAARVAVAGDSAGGNLSAVVCIDTAVDAVRPCFQALVYPTTDDTQSFGSIRSMADAPFLDAAAVDWYRAQYASDPALWRHPRVSPWLHPDVSGLPPALVQTAGFDPLRDEGEGYGEKLRAAGVPVTVTRYPSLSHGYLNMLGTLDAADQPWRELVAALRDAFR